MKTAGFVRNVKDTNTKADPDGPPLIEAVSPELEARKDWLLAEYRQLRVQRQIAQTGPLQ